MEREVGEATAQNEMLSRRFRGSKDPVTAVAAACSLGQQRYFMKGMFGGKKDDANKDQPDKSKEGANPMEGMFPPGMGAMGPKMMKEFMKKPPEQQLELMRQALEMQKKFGGNLPGLGKLNEKNAAFMEGMINNLETKVKSNPSQSHTNDVSATTQTPASAAAKPTQGFRSPSGPTLDELRKINLGAELEELFTELGSMRAKRNHYRSELEKKETQLLSAQKEADESKAKAADLRSRLSAAENTVRIMNTETMSLKTSVQTIKTIQEENRRLNAKVASLQSNDTVPLKQRIATLEAELGQAQDSVKALQRKLDRMRRRDPVAQFSLLLNDIRTNIQHNAHHSHSTSNEHAHADEAGPATPHNVLAAHEEQDASHHADLFSAIQAAYDGAVHEAWSQCAPRATSALIAACEHFVLKGLGRTYGKLDAHVSVVSAECADTLKSLAKEKGYEVASHTDGTYVVSLPADSSSPAFLGPYGFLAVYSHCHPEVFTGVKPFISDTLARNSKRVAINTSTTRSSGPGGQAANTAETQVSMTFVLDGERMFVSEAQDTRSQVANKDLAQTRLFEDKLSLFNKKLAAARHSFLSNSGAVSEGRAVVEVERWNDGTTGLSSCINDLGELDQAVLQFTQKSITN